ncbi:solute carrier family 2, facilitated glucose transporter member 1-like [Glandiceps talaboti]
MADIELDKYSKSHEKYNDEKSESEEEQGKLTCMVIYATVVTCLTGSIVDGWNTGVMSAPSSYIIDFYNSSAERYGGISDDGLTWLYAWSISFLAIGGAIGAIASAPIGDIMGRKWGSMISNVWNLTAALMFGACIISNNFEMVLMARLIVGFYIGIVNTIIPLYLAEISPKHIRGAVGVNHHLAICLGVLVAEVISIYVLNDEDNWHILLALTGVFSIAMFIFFPICPESPRWQLVVDKDIESAEKSLKVCTGEDDVKFAIDEIKYEYVEELKEPPVSLKQLFSNKNYRMPLIISTMSHAFHQLVGSHAFFFYATEICYMIWPDDHDRVHLATIGIGTINVLANIAAIPVIEKVGRRQLLIYPYALMVFFTAFLVFFLVIVEEGEAVNYMALVCVYGYIINFAIGPGPVPYVLVTEVWSQGPRPTATSVSLQVNWWCNFIIQFFFPILQTSMGEYVFAIFMMFSLIALIFTYFYVPETMGKSFEEIVAGFRVEDRIDTVPYADLLRRDSSFASLGDLPPNVTMSPSAADLQQMGYDDDVFDNEGLTF